MSKSKVFLGLALSFLGGIFSRSFVDFSAMENLLLVLAVIIFVLFYKNTKALAISLSLAFFVLGVWRTEAPLAKLSRLNLAGKNIAEKAMVVREPEPAEKFQKLVLRLEKENVRVLTTAGRFEAYEYGDMVRTECLLKIPENFSADFDYRMYLAKDDIYYLCDQARLEKLDENRGNKIYALAIDWKNKISEKIEERIPAPEAGLLSGLLLGGDNKLSQKMRDNFSRTGMTHIVAVSGYNVTIIAEYLMFLGIFLGLWRKQAFWFALFGISFFIFMIGFPSSAVRAGVMGSLLLWAMKNGRLGNSTNAIVFAAATMLLINPLLLRWDIGFQLSFLATLGIIYLYPLAENYFVKRDKAFGLSEILFLTISAQIFVLPVILLNFHNLSVISPVANVLVLPIIPLTMLLGFLALALDFIFSPLAMVFSWLAFLPLKYETLIINFLAGLQWASVEIKNFTWFGVLVLYLMLAGCIIIFRKRSKIYAE